MKLPFELPEVNGYRLYGVRVVDSGVAAKLEVKTPYLNFAKHFSVHSFTIN